MVCLQMEKRAETCSSRKINVFFFAKEFLYHDDCVVDKFAVCGESVLLTSNLF